MAGEFVEGWFAAQVLGEGAYGEVRLLVHARTGACVALKAVRAGGAPGSGGAREAALHRALRHPHVLRCLGERQHQDMHYLFLEYAQGGELFDRIEPDVGMGEVQAKRYWRQALAGLAYLHARGVAHRDIKPENLLLDHRDQVKISDFGMATLFRHEGRERLLTRVCGTLPYAAPEVLAAERAPYRAAPADVWSAGVLLLALLAGELPWERALESDARYAAWCRWLEAPSERLVGPWRKLSAGALALLRRLLGRAVRRPTLPALLQHRWLGHVPDELDGGGGGAVRVCSSQPAGGGGGGEVGELSAATLDALLSHSQPAHADDLLLGSPPDAGTQRGVLARLVRRMTRVWVRCDAASAERALLDVLRQKGHAWRHLQPRLVTKKHAVDLMKLSGYLLPIDVRNNPKSDIALFKAGFIFNLAIECGCGVKMRAWACSVREDEGSEARAMLEFRRSRGCGLAFKRRYLELRDALSPLAVPPPELPPLSPPRPLPMDMDTEADAVA